MARKITGLSNTLVTLSGVDDNPATIDVSGVLNAGLLATILDTDWNISNAGSILGAGVMLQSAGTLDNLGMIVGRDGTFLDFKDERSGGTAVSILTGTLVNGGDILGGSGVDAPYYYVGEGGTAVSILNGALLVNNGAIRGGSGGDGITGYGSKFADAFAGGGGGGIGAYVPSGTIDNKGSIAGGAGGSGSVGIGRGWQGEIGYPGLETAGLAGAKGGAGGDGFFLGIGSLANSGTITGGGGGNGGKGGPGSPGTENFPSGANGAQGAGGTGGTGVTLSSASLTNLGTIAGGSGGGTGVMVVAGGTVTNAGAISGTDGADAVHFATGYANRLVVAPGATFTGLVNGGNAAGSKFPSTLELGPGAGGITGLGTQFINFNRLQIDVAASWTIGIAAPASYTATIAGLDGDDTLNLVGIAPTGVLGANLLAGNILSVSRDGTKVASLHLDPVQSFAGYAFLATKGAGGTGITILLDRTVLSIAALNAVQAEGNAGSKAFTFTVTRSDTSSAQSAKWSAAGTAGTGTQPAGANPSYSRHGRDSLAGVS